MYTNVNTSIGSGHPGGVVIEDAFAELMVDIPIHIECRHCKGQ